MFRIISKKKLEELELNALKADMVSRVQDFMEKCGQNTTSHDPAQVSLYIGLMAEEMSEVIECLVNAMPFGDMGMRHLCHSLISQLDHLSAIGKQGKLAGRVRAANQEQLLDGFIDSAIVSLGAAISSSPHAYLATREVLNANDAKTTGGRDENGKIKKPEGWQPPDLSDCVYKK